MKCSWWFPLFSLCVAVAGCKTANPAVCCLDPADCNAVGIPEDMRGCAMGLACVDNACVVPSCSMQGCMPGAPVCNIATDVCEGCTDSASCSQFPDQGLCDTASGSCVECVASTDCAGTTPFCDANACRACKLDVECASGACGDDGACVGESAAIYLDTQGVDSGTCIRTTPCRTLVFAAGRASATRNHIVMATGTYTGLSRIGPTDTVAPSLTIHGGGATLTSAPGDEGQILNMDVPGRVTDLRFLGAGIAYYVHLSGNPLVVERVAFRGIAFSVSGNVMIRDFSLTDPPIPAPAVYFTGSLTLDRGVIHGGERGVQNDNSGFPVINMSNVLVFGTSDLAVDLSRSTGTVRFVTVADTGSDNGTGPRAFACGGHTLQSSIIWVPGSTRAPLAGACPLSSVIAGPVAVPGAMNVNPAFADTVSRNYHLAENSPARDMVETGPATDFEGDPRPRGPRFDIGADEAAP